MGSVPWTGPGERQQACQRRGQYFPPVGGARKIARMSMLQIILLVLLIALIGFWFFMRNRGQR